MADRVNKAASSQDMEDLHSLLAQQMLDRLKSGEALSSNEMSVIRQFLRDNGIEAARDNRQIHSLAEEAPTFDETHGAA